jgi:SAM-dependent methyltransferase
MRKKDSVQDNSRTKNVLKEIKWRILGKTKYGKFWQDFDEEWYNDIHDPNYLLNENFKQFLNSHRDEIQTVLEVGCGGGVYPIKNKELFSGMSYTGLDISQSAVEYCKKNSQFNFICADVLKIDKSKKYDLVFSHHVVDHVYDIDGFVRKLISLSKKFVYLSAYRGFFPDLDEHKMSWSEDYTCYFNDLSVTKLEKLLLKNGLRKGEFVIRPQKSGQPKSKAEIHTIIEINMKNSS